MFSVLLHGHTLRVYLLCMCPWIDSNLVLYKEDIPASWTALFPHSCWYKSRILIVAHLNGFHPMLLHVYAKKLLRKPPSTCFSMRVLGSCFALVCQTWHACTEAQPEPVGWNIVPISTNNVHHQLRTYIVIGGWVSPLWCWWSSLKAVITLLPWEQRSHTQYFFPTFPRQPARTKHWKEGTCTEV